MYNVVMKSLAFYCMLRIFVWSLFGYGLERSNRQSIWERHNVSHLTCIWHQPLQSFHFLIDPVSTPLHRYKTSITTYDTIEYCYSSENIFYAFFSSCSSSRIFVFFLLLWSLLAFLRQSTQLEKCCKCYPFWLIMNSGSSNSPCGVGPASFSFCCFPFLFLQSFLLKLDKTITSDWKFRFVCHWLKKN